jgi:hypothetical protein
LALFLSFTLTAQENSHIAFDIGGGFTQPIGNTGRYIDNGWNLGGGVGWNFTPYVGAMVQTNYNSLGINSSTLSDIGVPGGGTSSPRPSIRSSTFIPTATGTPISSAAVDSITSIRP